MSSINFHITYERQPAKKITVAKAYTINQLISLSLGAFHIDKTLYIGKLYHKDKLLDGSLPIRLTNLLNNSKLILKTSEITNSLTASSSSTTSSTSTSTTNSSGNHQINVKFINPEGSGSIKKISNSLRLNEVIDIFSNGIDNSRSSNLRILDLIIESDKYHETSLVSIVGDANNVVIRMNYSKSNNGNEEQLEAIRTHVELERLRKEKEKQLRLAELEEEEEKKKKKKEEEEEMAEVPKLTSEVKSLHDVEMKEPDEEVNEKVVAKSEPEVKQHSIKDEIIEDADHYTFKEEEIQDTPQLYIPSKTPAKVYNNPDEDYEVTLNQVKAYQNMIRNSAKGKSSSSSLSSKDKSPVPTVPKKYQIRIKFPDGAILQINFIEKIEEIKFGNLIKKIDELLLPEFINEYNLKNGVPPFKNLDMNFTTNNEYLYKLPDFKQERIMLIWELQKQNLNKSKGPFIKNSDSSNQLNVKSIDELPERVLENHRGELPDDEHKKSHKTSTKSDHHEENEESGTKSDKKSSKLPKWFKMK